MATSLSRSMHTVIYLMNRDLRLHDNECFHYIDTLHKKYITENNQKNQFGTSFKMVPLYCFNPVEYNAKTSIFQFEKTGEHRLRFIIEALSDLKQMLRSKGSDLILKSSNYENALLSVIQKLKSQEKENTEKITKFSYTLIYHEETLSLLENEEESIMRICNSNDIDIKKFWGGTLYHKEDMPFRKLSIQAGFVPDIPDIFTQFRKEIESKSKVRSTFPTPALLPPVPDAINSDDLPSYDIDGKKYLESLENKGFWSLENTNDDQKKPEISAFPFKGGEIAALQRLHYYIWESKKITSYKQTRNGLMGTDYSTKFSPWLAIGNLSPRYVYADVKHYERSYTANESTYWVVFELIWRDFFRFVAMKYGNYLFRESGIRGISNNWVKDMQLFDKWKKGITGVPFIDANMRELLHTGWMSNRGRQNVASFLVKDLKLDWRLGAEWFESMLIDHDVCSNYGNWNYAAGVGNDPREDRKFNIIKQSLDYDSNGDFIATWVPELSKLIDKKSHTKSFIHFPWTCKEQELRNIGINLGVTYPRPIKLAKEWDRYYQKHINEESTRTMKSIDFYFKADAKKT